MYARTGPGCDAYLTEALAIAYKHMLRGNPNYLNPMEKARREQA
jgi:hypothetical protein